MNKAEFVCAVAAHAALSPAQVSLVLHGIEEIAAEELKQRGLVRVPGLVTLKRLERSARLVRNPRSGQEFLMGASVLVKSKPINSFADRIKAENPL
jgi:nucleoid DNA-binding protein